MKNISQIKADLHNHLKTRHNLAEAYTFDEISRLGRKRLDSGGILGVVNFADKRYEQVRDLPGTLRRDLGCGFYVPKSELIIVKGEEVPTKQGHILVFGVSGDKRIALGRSLEDTIKEVKDVNGIIIADHPFVGVWEGVGSYLEKNEHILANFDAIEVFNGEAAAARIPYITPDPNKRAIDFYRKKKTDFPHLGAITTSDGHSAAEIGRSYTRMKIPDNYQKVLLAASTTKDTLTEILRNAIRASTPEDGVGRATWIRAFMHTGVVIWDHKIRNGDPSMRLPKVGSFADSFGNMMDDLRSRYSPGYYRDENTEKHQEALEKNGTTTGLSTQEHVIRRYRR